MLKKDKSIKLYIFNTRVNVKIKGLPWLNIFCLGQANYSNVWGHANYILVYKYTNVWGQAKYTNVWVQAKCTNVWGQAKLYKCLGSS